MQDLILFVMAFSLGFVHTFEADHLAAVTNLVTRNVGFSATAKDGFYWGLGHTAMIWLIGLVMLGLKYSISESYFTKLEGVVGVMLVLLGAVRLMHFNKGHQHSNSSTPQLALGVGIVHGLAGSGAVVAAAVTETSVVTSGLAYLLLFGCGSIAGMFSVSAGLSWMLNQLNLKINTLVHVFTFCSALFCIVYGSVMIYTAWS